MVIFQFVAFAFFNWSNFRYSYRFELFKNFDNLNREDKQVIIKLNCKTCGTVQYVVISLENRIFKMLLGVQNISKRVRILLLILAAIS